MRLLPYDSIYNDLGYKAITYKIGIEINVYAQDIDLATKRLSKYYVNDIITSKINSFFNENIKMSINIQPNVENIDKNIARTIITLNGLIDKITTNNVIIKPM